MRSDLPFLMVSWMLHIHAVLPAVLAALRVRRVAGATGSGL